MARFKVRSKKPKDSIKGKIPKHEMVTTIVQKTPNDSKEQFKLPPTRKNGEKIVRKESAIPSTKGGISKSKRKKDPVNQKVPMRIKDKQDHKSTPPTRRGIAKKKPHRIINKRPPRALHKKIPTRKTVPPPSTLNSKQKSKETILNKTPPKSITQKRPMEPKSIPPTTIKTKIPKIKRKTPE
ncbi:MAG: hypothetical protein ACW97P_00190 [Candidatus Hodarchaeales archaeon]